MLDKNKLIEIIQNMSEEDYAAFAASLSSNSVLDRYSETIFDPLYNNANYITEFLAGFGFNFKREGFKYIRTGIGIMLHEPEKVGQNITNLYYELAKRYGSSWSSIERGIRYSIQRRYDESYHAFDCFGHPWDFPKNKEFFTYAVEKLG